MGAVVAIRPATPEDAHFILDSFARSYRSAAFADGLGPATLRALIKPLLASWHTLMAVATDDTTYDLGWLCYRDATTVGYCFVKPEHRRKGVARYLLAHAGVAPGAVVTPFAHSRVGNWVRDAGYVTTFRPFLVVEEAMRAERA